MGQRLEKGESDGEREVEKEGRSKVRGFDFRCETAAGRKREAHGSNHSAQFLLGRLNHYLGSVTTFTLSGLTPAFRPTVSPLSRAGKNARYKRRDPRLKFSHPGLDGVLLIRDSHRLVSERACKSLPIVIKGLLRRKERD
ncbi:hypothetical protein PoB_007485300 [Plakobranchus ocellatus]|uniref:Uncharacterized protein n=1 Tax=Plakobranchus ocellatus TaxID=259542 RepID=A0AAV4DVR9_9GAST|nr:hypothetical protein PoB_007485300 [Plakobranchus ocellatus]